MAKRDTDRQGLDSRAHAGDGGSAAQEAGATDRLAETALGALAGNLEGEELTIAQDLERAILETGERMLPYFRFAHLPAGMMRETSASVAKLIVHLVQRLPPNPERTVMFRKFLEGKDCGVRSLL